MFPSLRLQPMPAANRLPRRWRLAWMKWYVDDMHKKQFRNLKADPPHQVTKPFTIRDLLPKMQALVAKISG